jgi:hypothetical protein
MTGQMSRSVAIDRLGNSELSVLDLEKEFEYVASKLDLNEDELRALFKQNNKTFADYKNKRYLIGIGARILQMLGVEKRLFR